MTGPDDPFTKRPAPSEGGSAPVDRPTYGNPPAYGSQPGGCASTPGPVDKPSYGQPPAGGYGTPMPAYTGGQDAFGGGSGRPELASWGRRVGGAVIDGIISGILQGIGTAVSPSLGRLVGLVVFLVFGYLTGTTGQTPGRRVMGITVRREADGQLLGAGAGIGRSFLHILDALPLLLGFLWPIWDKKNQTFADKIIGSVVVRT